MLAAGFAGYKIFKTKDNSKNILTEIVQKRTLRQTVLATGEVVSQTDLELAFKNSGFVQKVNVKEGQAVRVGEVLATLGQGDQLASLTSAKGALAQAKANYQKVLDGASSEEIIVAQRAVDAAYVALDSAKTSLNNTKFQQETAVSNAYSALLNSTITAVANPNNIGSATITVSGSYSGQEQGVYRITIYNAGDGQKFQASGLEQAEGYIKTAPVAMGKRGLFLQFSGTVNNLDSWSIAIPNTSASNYVANNNLYLAALKTQSSTVAAAEASVAAAQSDLLKAQASLDLKKAQARPADIDAAKAQILSAQGQVLAAEAALENTILRAPSSGTITRVDIKAGEQATAQKTAMVLQDVENLHIEVNVSEANIAQVRQNQKVDVTFDALGPDRHFEAVVQTVNPASTVVSGVVNYKVTAALNSIAEIKPGYTSNMTILVAEKSDVLAIPLRAVISNGFAARASGSKFVRVIDDSKKKTFREAEVKTGMEADGGLVEIISGLNEGQEIVTYIKN